jgi:hypothetical protein
LAGESDGLGMVKGKAGMKKLWNRKLIPLYAVLALLVLAFATPLPGYAGSQIQALIAATTLGAHDNGVGQGPAQGKGNGGNNCGIKGDGTQGTGSPCPNYPFPGR